MLKKWKDKDRWMERRRSEPSDGGEEEDRRTDLRHRQTHRRMLRRKSEPCGQMERDEKNEEKSNWTRSESTIKEDRMETGSGKDQGKCSTMVEDRVGGQVDRIQRDMDRKWMRRRSEPCGALHVQLLHLSVRKRWTGRRTSCSKGEDRQVDRRLEDDQITRGTSEPIGPLNNSKTNLWYQ